MVNNRTYIDPEGMRGSATHIGGLVDDLTPFHAVSAIQTKSGNFPAAHWLDGVIAQRGQGTFQHGQGLHLVCHDINDGLHGVVDTFEQTDDSNADGLDRSVFHEVNATRLKSWQDTQESADVNRDA
ncbi:hypothetical protein [Kutzneria kofuensis]|uniref:Uncharacterized protein n=1 Tax=Kutzneria kofuensis TaxID=103725 RepID=A0A7W9NLC9_9PSEU|nr:hypothetical protein [Kutzneria kofuensis]MBB5896316.1 hypothetical protein [Kutzneria kofuensis]